MDCFCLRTDLFLYWSLFFPLPHWSHVQRNGGGLQLTGRTKPPSFLVVLLGTKTGTELLDLLLSTCKPLLINAFKTIGMPIEASKVPKKPPDCALVGLITICPPVCIALTICFFCASVIQSLYFF